MTQSLKKFFIVTDIHGFYSYMKAALDAAGFDATNANHIFVSLGDLFDRGSESVKCLDFVCSLPEDRCILIRGNHEDLLEYCIKHNKWGMIDIQNGTLDTLSQFNCAEQPKKLKENKLMQKYFSSLRNFYETKNSIFVHGWIPRTKKGIDWRTCDMKQWDDARWFNGMDMWQKGIMEKGKTIFCGHWHASWGHHFIDKTSLEFPNPYSTNPEHQKADFTPFKKDGIVALDACTALSHKVNCVVIEDELL